MAGRVSRVVLAVVTTGAVVAGCGTPSAGGGVLIGGGSEGAVALAAGVSADVPAEPAVDELGIEVMTDDGDVVSDADEGGSSDLIEAREGSGGWAVSPPTTTDEYSMVGVTWPEDGADGGTPRVQVRTRGADGAWSRWAELPVSDEEPDVGGPDARRRLRDGTDPIWVGASEAVQIRVATSAPLPDHSRLSLVDPGDEPGHASTASTRLPAAVRSAAAVRTTPTGVAPTGAVVVTTAPPIITRAEWGAPSPVCEPSVATKLVGSVVHHTASANSYSTLAEAKAQVRGFFKYHTQSRGWCDIGYNFLVDKWGNIYEGRAGSGTAPVIGVHAGGFNTGTLGVSMIGDYSTLTPSPAMQESVARVIAWRLGAYGVDPQGSMTYRTYGGENSRYASGDIDLPTVLPHRQVAYTSCPGDAAYRILGSIRARAAALIATGIPLNGAIRDWYLSNTAPASKLGTVVTREREVGAGVWEQVFSNGTLTFTAATGVVPTFAFIDRIFRSAGGAGGKLGAPTAAEASLGGGVWTQEFEGGTVTFSSAGTFATFAFIDEVLRLTGGAGGKLGAPVGAETYVGAGRWSQRFSGGSVTYSPEFGAVPTFAYIDAGYRRLGGAGGKLGVPTAGESASAAGVWTQPFEHGSMTFSSSGGAVPTFAYIDAAYLAAGGAAGALGAPCGPEAYVSDGMWLQRFDHGSITYSPEAGAVVTYGAIDVSYRAAGGPRGKLGPPIAAEVGPGPGTSTQRFAHGSLTVSPATGAVPTFGYIDATYRAAGGPAGALGVPRAAEVYLGAGAWSQAFTGGVVTFTPARGAVATLG